MRITPETPIVLGSASPRRRELLSLASIPFIVHSANTNEAGRPGEAADAYLERIARAKLDAVRAMIAEGTANARARGAIGILVADTIVVAPDAAVFGKPSGEAEGRSMLERLAGATHTVRTRFLLAGADPSAPPRHAQTVITQVTFRALAAREVEHYVASGEGKDKAGGYAVQGGAAAFVERIDGSYTNVVGLPLAEVVIALRGLGWLAA